MKGDVVLAFCQQETIGRRKGSLTPSGNFSVKAATATLLIYRGIAVSFQEGAPAPDAESSCRMTMSTHERSQTGLAIFLALTAGYVDGYGFLILGAYVSFMSGNTTIAGLRTGQENVVAAFSPAIAIVSFVAGAVAGNLVIHSRLRYALRLLLSTIAFLLLIVLILSNHAAPKELSIGLLSFGMGMVNPVVSGIGAETVSLTFVTGTLGRIGSHLALAMRRTPVAGAKGPWDTHLYRARVGAQVWGSFIAGAALSGVVMSLTRKFTLAPGIAILVVLAMLSRSEPVSQ